ncbi:hypothetical protein Bca4012_067214 [Brassica carinata]
MALLLGGVAYRAFHGVGNPLRLFFLNKCSASSMRVCLASGIVAVLCWLLLRRPFASSSWRSQILKTGS